jgi:lipoate-protein ligase A
VTGAPPVVPAGGGPGQIVVAEGLYGAAEPLRAACAAKGWMFGEDTGPAGELHDRAAALLAHPVPPGVVSLSHMVRLLWPVGRALVLGSGQDASLVDLEGCRQQGAQVAKRRSGGGAVLVEPGGQVWADIVVPRGSPLWDDDVSKASWWLGEAWAGALEAAGAGGAKVWKGPMHHSEWSRLYCFAGTGPGEVLGPGERKWVGISQRRTRYGAVLQSSCLLRWQPEVLVSCMTLDAAERRRAVAYLGAAASGVSVSLVAVVEALVERLPDVRSSG